MGSVLWRMEITLGGVVVQLKQIPLIHEAERRSLQGIGIMTKAGFA